MTHLHARARRDRNRAAIARASIRRRTGATASAWHAVHVDRRIVRALAQRPYGGEELRSAGLARLFQVPRLAGDAPAVGVQAARLLEPPLRGVGAAALLQDQPQ